MADFGIIKNQFSDGNNVDWPVLDTFDLYMSDS